MRKTAIASASFCAAIFLSQYLLPDHLLLYCSGLLFISAFTGFAFKGSKRLFIMLVLFGLSAGFLWSHAFSEIFYSPAKDLDGTRMKVTAVVKEYPTVTDYGSKTSISIQLPDSPDISAQLTVFDSSASSLVPGDIIETDAELKLTSALFDSGRDPFASRGVFLFASSPGDVEIIGKDSFRIQYTPQYIAKAMSDCISRVFPARFSAFFRALLLGNRTELTEDVGLMKALRVTGTYHIVAISGMHLSFFSGFFIPLLGRRRGTAVTLPAIWLFAAIAGFPASVVRAAFMQTAVLCAPFLRRDADSVTSLFLSLFILLLRNPFSAANAGLQLSFAATLGIILLSQRIHNAVCDPLFKRKWFVENRKRRYLLSSITSILSSSIGATVLTTPLTAIYFKNISLISPLVNLLIVSAVTLAFTLGMFACLAGLLFPFIGRLIAIAASAPAWYVTTVVRWLARARFASLYTSNIYAVWWLVYIYLLILCSWIFHAKLKQMLLPLCCGTIMLCAVLFYTVYRADTRAFELSVLDVGQGQCIIYTSGTATAMIDCGSSSGENAGEIAADYLRGLGRDRIDLLILTHYHSDHCNGLNDLLTHVNLTAVAAPIPEPDDEDSLADEVNELLSAANTEMVYVTDTVYVSFGMADITLYPPVGKDSENERCVTALLTSGTYDILITGDMPSISEKILVAVNNFPDIETYVVGHHGSKYSTSQELLDAVKPEIAIISVGRNSYGHPADETLQRLNKNHIMTYRTDTSGNIVISEKERSSR